MSLVTFRTQYPVSVPLVTAAFSADYILGLILIIVISATAFLCGRAQAVSPGPPALAQGPPAGRCTPETPPSSPLHRVIHLPSLGAVQVPR